MEAASEIVPARHLAQLVLWMPSWIASTAMESELDLEKAPGYMFEKTGTLVLRNHLNLVYHHRRQLTVYSRLLDVPLPPIYGRRRMSECKSPRLRSARHT